jgi:hypothetical protein
VLRFTAERLGLLLVVDTMWIHWLLQAAVAEALQVAVRADC